MGKGTMRAVVFKGPYNVVLEDRPIPEIREPTDMIVRVKYAALCGSELHIFRGYEPSPEGVIMGHEFTGEVVETGTAIQKFNVGDHVVSPFTISCSDCFYCKNGFSSRCDKSMVFGSAALDGAQADYVRVPLADATAVRAPDGIENRMLILMADIFPTGYFAARNAFQGMTAEQIANATVIIIGCGPVGLCALINAEAYKPKHLLAIDSVTSRLDLASSLGAEPWNFQSEDVNMYKRVKALTDGRGADMVVEAVGSSAALRMAFDLLRPWGWISSVGVHNSTIPWSASEAYDKNVRISMGRCPVRSIFAEALDLLKEKQHLLCFMTHNTMPLSRAVDAYDAFNAMKVQKVIFEL